MSRLIRSNPKGNNGKRPSSIHLVCRHCSGAVFPLAPDRRPDSRPAPASIYRLLLPHDVHTGRQVSRYGKSPTLPLALCISKRFDSTQVQKVTSPSSFLSVLFHLTSLTASFPTGLVSGCGQAALFEFYQGYYSLIPRYRQVSTQYYFCPRFLNARGELNLAT